MDTEHHYILEIFNSLLTNKLAEVCRYKEFPPLERYGMHNHQRIEINHVQQGECRMNINGQWIGFHTGETAYISPHVKHSFQAGEKGCTLMQLEFPSIIFKNFSELLNTISKIEERISESGYIKIVNNSEIKLTIKNIIEELESKRRYNRMTVLMYYGLLLVHVLRYINEHYALDTDNRHIEQAIKFIAENYSREISVREISDFAGISERYLRTLFIKHVHCTPSCYITTVRIEKALNLISNKSNKYSIKEISYICGFQSPQYFSKVFKSHTGQTPGEYASHC